MKNYFNNLPKWPDLGWVDTDHGRQIAKVRAPFRKVNCTCIYFLISAKIKYKGVWILV